MKFFYTLYIMLLFAFGCQKSDFKIPSDSQIFGLASEIKLSGDTTKIYLTDYFTDVSKIDSIKTEKGLKIILSNDKKIATLIASEKLPRLSVISLFSNGYKYNILVKKSTKINYKFVFVPHGKSYKTVAIRGEMNAWNAAKNLLKFDKGVWTTHFHLEPGTYQYLLVIDGKETLDPNNPDSVSNNMGGYNSLLKVGKNNPDSVPFLFTQSFDKQSVTIGIENKVKRFVVFIDNFMLPKKYIKQTKNTLTINLPQAVSNKKRAYIRVWAYNKFGYSNDVKIPLEKGVPLHESSKLKRTDYEAAVIYNVFVDRFFNGNPDNDAPLNSPEVLPKADYYGGDIQGVTTKVKEGYFDSLGINTIWLSPVVKNVSGAYGFWKNPETKFSAYHGYWPVSFTQIDEHYGTAEDFQELVEQLHAQNANILVDFVAHHLHKNAKFYKEHPQWFTNLYLPDGTLNTERWDTHRLTTWFDTFLPTIDNNIPEVADIVSDSALWWCKTYNIDGFRHDAAKHVPLSFWRRLTFKLKTQIEIPENKKLYQIGETYGSPELIAGYLGSGMLDAQFDFNVYDAFVGCVVGGNSFENLRKTLLTSFKYYGWHNLMGYITGNQDRGRFISYAGGDLQLGEDAKAAGWTRKIGVGNDIAYRRSALLFAFITTIPGVPVIYYGDEIGMPGGNDPDNRRPMIFSGLNEKQKHLKRQAAKLIKFRRSYMPFIFGDFKFLFTNDDVIVYQRSYFGQLAVVALNKSEKQQNISFKAPANFDYHNLKTLNTNTLQYKDGKIYISLSPVDFGIFWK